MFRNPFNFPAFPPPEGTTLRIFSDLGRLCKACSHLVDGIETLKSGPRIAPLSGQRDCPLCNAGRQAIRGSQDGTPEGIEFTLASPSSFYVQDKQEKSSFCLLSVRREPTLDSVKGLFTDPGFQAPLHSISFARAQLDNCLRNANHHCESGDDSLPPEWPSRVLRISQDTVRLLDFDLQLMPKGYTALSYCWGSDEELRRRPNLQTTTATYSSLRSGIPISHLPRTLRHAVWVTRCLGIDHIWIDSLCIIQDNKEDWHAEASKMATVYAKSTVTIIAASSTSCHSGLLPWDGPSTCAQRLDFPLLSNLGLYTTQMVDGGFHSHPAKDPIDKRGWTYQEEFLSTRHLKFTGNDVQWRCSAGAVCLCGYPPSLKFTTEWNKMHPPKGPRLRAGGEGYGPESAAARWDDAIQNLSRRLFTKETDKLPAISGLARRFAAQRLKQGLPSKYIAGCWEDGIMNLRELEWEVPGLKDPRFSWETNRCPESYIAPSFVWASVNGPVRYAYRSEGQPQLTQVVAIDVQHGVPGNSFGAVVGGTLMLRGPIISRCVISSSDEDDGNGNTGGPSSFQLEIGKDTCPSLPTTCELINCRPDCRVAQSASVGRAPSIHRCPGASCSLAQDPLSCQTPLGAGREDGMAAEVDLLLLRWCPMRELRWRVPCLILGRHDPDGSAYQRIGMVDLFCLQGPEPSEEDFEAWTREVIIH